MKCEGINMKTFIDVILTQEKKVPSYEKEYAKEYKKKKGENRVSRDASIYDFVCKHFPGHQK